MRVSRTEQVVTYGVLAVAALWTHLMPHEGGHA